MAWAIRNLVWLCWLGHGDDLIRKWMNGHKHQEEEALVCVCAHSGVWCGAVSRPVCVFFQSMATQHSGLQSVLDVSVGLVQSAGPWQLPSAEELGSCCCAPLTEQSGVNIRNRSSGMGTDFPINLWFMLISFETLKKGALWAGISICALTALPRLKTEQLQHSWKQGEDKDGNVFWAFSEGHCPG